MQYNRSTRIVRGSIIDKTVHVQKNPSEEDIAVLVKMYGKLTDATLEHLKGCRGKPKNNAEYADLENQISTVEYALENFGLTYDNHVEVGGTYWITLIQPKVNPVEQRIKTLQELFYETFVGNLKPKGFKARPDYVYHARPMIRKLAREGGAAYNHALSTIKAAYISADDYRAAVQTVIPPLNSISA